MSDVWLLCLCLCLPLLLVLSRLATVRRHEAYEPAKGSYAVVSGATGGVGVELVKLLLQHGQRVICIARPSSDLSVLRGLGVSLVMCMRFDDTAGFSEQFSRFCRENHLKPTEISAFYALHGCGINSRVEALNAKETSSYLSANLLSHVFMVQYFLALPNVRHIGCVSSLNAHIPAFRMSFYAGSKAFLEKLFSAIIIENPDRRAVIVVPPAITGTRFLKQEALKGISDDGFVYKKPCAVESKFVAKELLTLKSGIHKIGWFTRVMSFMTALLGERALSGAMKHQIE